jgi:hypothetical protein
LPANGRVRFAVEDVEAAGGEVDAQDGQQHEHRASHRVEEELDGRVLRPVLRLPQMPIRKYIGTKPNSQKT